MRLGGDFAAFLMGRQDLCSIKGRIASNVLGLSILMVMTITGGGEDP